MNKNYIIVRADFMNDIHKILELYDKFLQDPGETDKDCDNWDFLLDECQNMFVKWIANAVEKIS
jgi:hypothetical protein